MHNILINIKDLKVVNYDNIIRPFQFSISVPSLNMNKTIQKEVLKPKTNFLGEKLYSVENAGKIVEVTENELYGRTGPIACDKILTQKIISFLTVPSEFTAEDIIDNKKAQLISMYNKSNGKLFEINLQSIIDFSYNDHKADTGFKLIRLHPNGSIKLKNITLGEDIKDALILIEATKSLNIKYTINEKEYKNIIDSNLNINNDIVFNNIDIIIENLSANSIDITSFAILF